MNDTTKQEEAELLTVSVPQRITFTIQCDGGPLLTIKPILTLVRLPKDSPGFQFKIEPISSTPGNLHIGLSGLEKNSVVTMSEDFFHAICAKNATAPGS